jgi:hypothetical protein
MLMGYWATSIKVTLMCSFTTPTCMELFDAKLDAACEGPQCIISRDICGPGYN